MSPKPCQEALSEISHMRITGSDLKGWFIFEFIKLVKKIVLPLSQSCRVVSEVIFQSTMPKPIQMEKPTTGVKDIMEG